MLLSLVVTILMLHGQWSQTCSPGRRSRSALGQVLHEHRLGVPYACPGAGRSVALVAMLGHRLEELRGEVHLRLDLAIALADQVAGDVRHGAGQRV